MSSSGPGRAEGFYDDVNQRLSAFSLPATFTLSCQLTVHEVTNEDSLLKRNVSVKNVTELTLRVKWG